MIIGITYVKGGFSLTISLMEHEQGFIITEGNKQFGKIVWQLDADVMVMNSIVIDASLREHDYGTKLLDAAAEYARAHDYKMEAICPFVAKKFEQTSAYDDLKV